MGFISIKRIDTNPRFSQAVVHENTLYTTGQVAQDSPDAPTAVQTKEILTRIDALLAQANTDKSKIIFATIWLADLKDYDEMNEVWDRWVPPGHAPARACIQAKLVSTFTVEISIIAAL